MKKRSKLTRRQLHQYQSILLGSGQSNHSYGYFLWRHSCDEELNAWAAFFFVLKCESRTGYDFNRLQNLVLHYGNPETIYRWAREIRGANVKKCQAAIMSRGTARDLRKFALNISAARQEELLNLALIKEVLAL